MHQGADAGMQLAPVSGPWLDFVCNVCGTLHCERVAKFHRELAACPVCGASARFRGMVAALGQVLHMPAQVPLIDWPERPDVRGLGMSDWPGYADVLARKMAYVNTHFDKPPYLDILQPAPQYLGVHDVVLSTDVLEHVLAPVQKAFDHLLALLKPGGWLVFSVPYTTFGANTQEAVTRFQAVNGLSADGLAGAKTQELLYSGNALSADQAPKPDFLILVNRQHKLGKNDAPTDLVTIENALSADIVKVKYSGTKADRTATEALGQMLSAAIADGVSNFQISSAYRTYSEQQKLVDNSVAKYRKNNPDWSRDRCLSATYNTVAPAGTSEHQTGLAFDITVPGVSFTGTQQQKWLHAHCAEYGFIVRFTAEKQKLTGFVAESWHFRYVGQEAAAVITQNGWCLEEYVEKMGL